MRISGLGEDAYDGKQCCPYHFFFPLPTQLSRRSNTVRELKKKKTFTGLCLFSTVHKGKK